MKLLHLSDIHGDLVALSTIKNYALKRHDLEVIVFSGDGLGECLNRSQIEIKQAAYSFIESRVQTSEPLSFENVLYHLLTSEEAPADIKKAAKDYVKVVREFDKNAEKQYSELVDIFKRFPQQVLTVPGNWDSPVYFKFFEEFDIHNKSKEINKIKFAGYGGDNWIPVCVPETRTIGLSERELHDFLIQEDPDVAVTHVPPKSLQDEGGNMGNWANLCYIRTESPILSLCGHAHESRGIGKERHQETIVINPGNLGHYDGALNKGTFYEIELNKKGVISAIPYIILGGEIIRDENADSINGDLVGAEIKTKE